MTTVAGVLRSKVFIGCIPTTAEEAQVRSVLAEYGKVIGFFYCRDGMNSDRGFAFATLSTEAEAISCVNALNNTIRFENSARPLQAKLSCEKIVDIAGTVFQEPPKGLPSSFWEEYTSDEGYPYYYNRETGETVWEKPKFFVPPLPVLPDPISSEGITPSGSVGYIQNSGYGPLGANLFLFHVPAEWTEESLRQKFEAFGQLVSCKVSVDDSGRSRGFGFIGYTTREAAAAAIQAMNGTPCGFGKFLKVTIKQGEEQYAIQSSEQPKDPPAS